MSTLLVEIGVEELPSGDVDSASRSFARLLADAVRSLGLGGTTPQRFATPRRLAVQIDGVAQARERTVRRVRGPSRDRAFEADGSPSKALAGFLKGQKSSLDAVVFDETPQGVYAVVEVQEGGEAAVDILGAAIERVLSQITFARPMRWGEGTVRFGRPVVWLCALLDRDVIPCRFAGIQAGRESLGHRFLHPGAVALGGPEDYEARLADAFVLADRTARRKALREGLTAAATAEGLWCEIPDALLEEVTDLVEWPTAFVGHVASRFLDLPDPALTTPMIHHQRQFPTRTAGPAGPRASAFVAVRNGGDRGLDLIRRGNERVLTARLTDALFFYERDRATDLETQRGRLAGTELGAGLGTLLDRADRTESIVRSAARRLPGLPWTEAALRAAHLAFADRSTLLVAEFPELTGEMAAVYASFAGEDEAVVRAIRESHRPRDAEGEVPEDSAGRLVALAMRAEEVLGAFAAGRIPTGSEDPYGVRRAALGIVRIGLRDGVPGGLLALLGDAAGSLQAMFPPDTCQTALAKATTFIRERVESRLADDGFSAEVAHAVCAADIDRMETVEPRARALTEALRGETADTLITAYRRAARLREQAADPPGAENASDAAPDGPGFAPGSAEDHLDRSLRDLERAAVEDLAFRDPTAYFAGVSALAEPLDRFFREVMVVDPDPQVRSMRLGLLGRVTRVASLGADLSGLGRKRTDLPGSGHP